MKDETPASSDHWGAYQHAILHRRHGSGAISYLTRNALSINEAGTPINFHIRWSPFFFIYLYAFGRRWHYARR